MYVTSTQKKEHREIEKKKEAARNASKLTPVEQRKRAQSAKRNRVPKNEWASRIRRWDELNDRDKFVEEFPDMRTAENAAKRISDWRKFLLRDAKKAAKQ